MKRRFGLRAQFILLIVLGLFALFSLFAIVAIRQQTSTLRKSLQEGSLSFASLATKPIGDTFVLYQDSGRLKIEQQIEKFTQLDSNVTNVTIVDVNGKVLYQQEETPVEVTVAQASSFDTIFQDMGNGVTQVITPYIEDFGAHRYSIVYDISDLAIRNAARQLTEQIAALAMLGLLTTIAVSYFVINRLFLKPLGDVSEAATAISKGSYDIKIKPEHNDEIGDVALSVNAMAEALKEDIRKLKELDETKTEFMTIASHNLRTPLTIINGYLESLRLSNELSEASMRMVETIAASGSRLSAFAEDMLIIARIESGEQIVANSKDEFDLAEIVRAVAKDAEPLARDKQLRFVVNISEGRFNMKGSRPHIRAALWNVIDNAFKFTKQGSVTLTLTAQQESRSAQLTVEDTGVGISEKEMPKLFTKFHRGTDVMEYNYEGTGLGLYLTKLIIEQQAGSININSVEDQGTKVTITLPLG